MPSITEFESNEKISYDVQEKIFKKLDDFIYYLSKEYDPTLLKVIEKELITRECNKFKKGYFQKIENSIKQELISFNEIKNAKNMNLNVESNNYESKELLDDDEDDIFYDAVDENLQSLS
jgi:hypothetical protein